MACAGLSREPAAKRAGFRFAARRSLEGLWAVTSSTGGVERLFGYMTSLLLQRVARGLGTCDRRYGHGTWGERGWTGSQRQETDRGKTFLCRKRRRRRERWDKDPGRRSRILSEFGGPRIPRSIGVGDQSTARARKSELGQRVLRFSSGVGCDA